MLTELDYRTDSTQVFQNLLDLPYCVFLDSGHGTPYAGRYEILAASPYLTLTTRGDETEIRSRERVEISRDDPLALVEAHLGPIDRGVDELPFTGGAIGYMAYDLGRRFEDFDATAVGDIDMPEMVVGIYDWAVIVDHLRQRSVLVGGGRDTHLGEP